VNGPIALHGGGEFLPGDEPFLRAILELAPRSDGAVRVAVVPTAAARSRPDLAAANGVAAFRRVAAAAAIAIVVEAVRVVDPASAADPALAAQLAAATLIHLPGGDPDIIPTLYPGTAAWAAIEGARAGGAVLAGASAGAMALAAWTWTPNGGMPGLGLVPGIGVAPHADAASWRQAVARYGAAVPLDLGFVGLAERTAVIVPGTAGEPWRVVGEGEVRWLSAAARAAGEAPVVLRDGETIGL
jgi:cyanophycinase-like exopeptidase